jgi:hypothetical protein
MSEDTADDVREEKPPKYSKPRVMMIDVAGDAWKMLRDAGFNVHAGTYGHPYRVGMEGYKPVIGEANLVGLPEMEIVIVDLAPDIEEAPSGEKATPESEWDWWVKCSAGVIDPRPRFMMSAHKYTDRILEQGEGLFVIFADNPFLQVIEISRLHYGNRFEKGGTELTITNWSFLSILNQLRMQPDYGTEVSIAETNIITESLRPHLNHVSFSVALDVNRRHQNQEPLIPYFPLLRNKYGHTVGAMIGAKNGRGLVLILPQFKDKAAVLLDLFRNVLPNISPHLFPHFEGGQWIKRPEYEHPVVAEKSARQRGILQKADAEVAAIEETIRADRERLGFLHRILTATGDDLVAAIKRSLEFAGCPEVVDVDELIEGGANLQEDLRVPEQLRVLLLEVKGLAGFPREANTLQIAKFMLRRQREWRDKDVRGLCLINHQRHLPAAERDHDRVFTDAQVADATNLEFGLMTTWDLYRLLRGMERWGWPKEVVQQSLWQMGRTGLVPSNYSPVARVAHFFDGISVISLEILDGTELRPGDVLGYDLPLGWHQEAVAELQIRNHSVEVATSGQRAGHKTSLARSELTVGHVVYKVLS